MTIEHFASNGKKLWEDEVMPPDERVKLYHAKHPEMSYLDCVRTVAGGAADDVKVYRDEAGAVYFSDEIETRQVLRDIEELRQ